MATFDSSEIRVGAADLTYKSVALGYSEDVVVKAAKKFIDIKTAQTGENVIDKVLVGQEVTIEVTAKESQVALWKLAFPWYTSGAVQMAGQVGTGMYQYAGALLVHPRDRGVGTGEDHTFAKAVPIGDYEVTYNTKGERMRKIVFYAFMDQAQLPNTIAQGTIG